MEGEKPLLYLKDKTMTTEYATQRTLMVKETNHKYKSTIITSSRKSEKYCRKFFNDDIAIFESFFILMLNRKNETIGWVKISQGGLSATVVDTRLIAKYCIDSLASAVILCHNHPSGNIQPSQADKNLTSKVIKGLSYLDINVLDHIILTESDYYSFADSGEI